MGLITKTKKHCRDEWPQVARQHWGSVVLLAILHATRAEAAEYMQAILVMFIGLWSSVKIRKLR